MEAPESYYEPKETERLYTRVITMDDAKLWEEWIMDPIATEHFPDSIKLSPEKSVDWIQRILDRYSKKAFGFHAIHRKDSHELVGQCGLLAQEVHGQPEIEVGYSFLRKHWGNGFAPEAAKMFMDLAFNEYEFDSIISLISPGNLNSQRVAQKNGLVKTIPFDFHGIPVEVWRKDK